MWGGQLNEPAPSGESMAQMGRRAVRSNPHGGGLLILESFYYCDGIVEKMIPYFESFMLDSEAFTFFSSGKRVDWNEYVGRYCDFIKRNNVQLFFELDIDALIGYDKVKDIRRRIERETGKQPIPVWHKRLGKAEFLKMCDEYPYVAIGGIVSREIVPKEYPYFTWFINEAHKRGCKIHGLGFTNLKGLTKYHFDSVDSTSWLSGNRFGSVYTFTGKTIVKKDKPQGSRLADSKAVAVHNFSEWAKFQQYAKEHL